MIADHFQGIEKFEADLWKIADNLRANSNLASNEYFMPIMGLIFLRQRPTASTRPRPAPWFATRRSALELLRPRYRAWRCDASHHEAERPREAAGFGWSSRTIRSRFQLHSATGDGLGALSRADNVWPPSPPQ
jgi:hypothetical protein